MPETTGNILFLSNLKSKKTKKHKPTIDLSVLKSIVDKEKDNSHPFTERTARM